MFASRYDARHASRREGEAIVASQVRSLKSISDALLRQAEGRAFGASFAMSEAEPIWQDVLAQREQWVSTQPAEGYREYVGRRAGLYPLAGLS
jgi:hypothetical protein